jgi:hypothetical protein
VDLADIVRRIQGDFRQVRLHCRNQLWIKGSDKVVIVLLLAWLGEGGPWQIINIPGMRKIDVGESKGNCSFRF